MSYRIDYETGSDMQDERKGSGLWTRTTCFFLLFLLLTQLCWPAGAVKVREMLCPWNPDVTAAAFSDLIRDVRYGLSAEDAVVTFCREILADAGIQH